MVAFLVTAWVMVAQVSSSNTIMPPPILPAPVSKALPPSQVVVVKSAPPVTRCNARPYQRLVGRTVSDLLTARLPQGTRIYRIDDPQTETSLAGRLSVELNRSTRVRRVYCS